MMTIAAEITKQLFEELQNGDASFNEVEWRVIIDGVIFERVEQ